MAAMMSVPVSFVGDGLVLLRRKHYDELAAMQRIALVNLGDWQSVRIIRQKAAIIRDSPNAWDVSALAKEIVGTCDKLLKKAEGVHP